MREIKFRGYDLERKEWVYGYFILFGDKAYIVEYGKPGIPAQYIEVNPKTVGEYTGLKDKNSKEIYEGDIVKWKDDFNKKEEVGRVFWHQPNSSFAIVGNLHIAKIPYLEEDKNSDIEIIGNIYENKDLLK